MPEPRPCAVCGAQIKWYENGLNIVALNTEPDLEGQYVILDGKAYHVDLLHEKKVSMLPDRSLFQNHVLTCKPPERKTK